MNKRKINVLDEIGAVTGAPVRALAIVGLNNQAGATNALAFLTPGSSTPAFAHAVTLEADYCDAVMGFEAEQAPSYGHARDLDLRAVACAAGLEEVLCLIVMWEDGQVTALRDYDGVEVTVLEAVKIQFDRMMEILETRAPSRALH